MHGPGPMRVDPRIPEYGQAGGRSPILQPPDQERASIELDNDRHRIVRRRLVRETSVTASFYWREDSSRTCRPYPWEEISWITYQERPSWNSG